MGKGNERIVREKKNISSILCRERPYESASANLIYNQKNKLAKHFNDFQNKFPLHVFLTVLSPSAFQMKIFDKNKDGRLDLNDLAR